MPTPAEFVEAQRARFEDELSDLLRIPSIGTLLVHRGETRIRRSIRARDRAHPQRGGSIPIVADFINRLGLPTVISGWGLPDSNVHSPDDKLDLAHFHKGIHAVMRFWERMPAT